MQDLQNNIRAMRCIGPVACGTTGTGVTGKIIDRKGYNGVEFVVGYGSVTATAATITLTVLEGDATGSMTSVADADLIGTEALASLGAGTRTSGATNGKFINKRIGYKGNKRYVTVKEVPTATAAAIVNVSAILFNPTVAPTSNP